MGMQMVFPAKRWKEMTPRAGVEISVGGSGGVPPLNREQSNLHMCCDVRVMNWLCVPCL